MRYPDYLVHYNKNHDKRTGRFTFGDGNGDGVLADSYRTPELDTAYNKYSSLLAEARDNEYNGPYQDTSRTKVDKSFDICLRALKNTINPDSIPDEAAEWTVDDWAEVLNDYYFGHQSIAYLASKGLDKNQIKNVLEINHKCYEANDKYKDAYDKYNPPPKIYERGQFQQRLNTIINSSPYPNANDFLENAAFSYIYPNPDPDSKGYKSLDKYIDECVKLSKEIKHADEYSEYLMHFNKNHDKKSGRFSFGDGDGDGIRDDHSNQSKKQSKSSDGSKKTIVVASPKNPRNPFSGKKKTKIEVSDDVYKEIMKADTKHAIKRGTGYLLNGAALIAVGVLTENPAALGVGVVNLVSSAAHYVESGTHFVNKIIDSKYKDKPVEELDTLVKVDPSIFNTKYYDTKTKEIRELSLKDARKEALDRAK